MTSKRFNAPADLAVTLDREPNARNGRTGFTISGRGVSGRGVASLYVERTGHSDRDGRPYPHAAGEDTLSVVVVVHTSESAVDDDGRTIYRDADESAGEVQTGSAVIVEPFRVNGVPIRSSAYLSAELDAAGGLVERHTGRPWRSDSSPRAERLTPGAVSDSAMTAAWHVADLVADQLATHGAIRRAVAAHYAGERARERERIREALASVESIERDAAARLSRIYGTPTTLDEMAPEVTA